MLHCNPIEIITRPEINDLSNLVVLAAAASVKLLHWRSLISSSKVFRNRLTKSTKATIKRRTESTTEILAV